MPFVRISAPAELTGEQIAAISEGIYQAMRSTINLPEGDRFQVITQSANVTRVADPAYLGVQRSEDIVFVEITLLRGRIDAQKQALFREIAANLHAAAGIRVEDVFTMLTENGSADWSFGNGEAQMLRPGVTKHWAADSESSG
jgi:phenylpyruvate tautomerase PptA (4-oxalocrotonate tautomerase family)